MMCDTILIFTLLLQRMAHTSLIKAIADQSFLPAISTAAIKGVIWEAGTKSQGTRLRARGIQYPLPVFSLRPFFQSSSLSSLKKDSTVSFFGNKTRDLFAGAIKQWRRTLSLNLYRGE